MRYDRPLVDPMGLLLQASRIDAVLHKAAKQVETELTQADTARLRCPTCKGEGVVFAGDDDDIGDACDVCEGYSGFLSYADSMKLLVATTRKLRDCLDLTGLWTARVADADAVLALVEPTSLRDNESEDG